MLRLWPAAEGDRAATRWTRRTCLLGALAVLGPLAFLSLFQQRFGYDPLVIPAGLALFLAGLALTALSGTIAARLIRRARSGRLGEAIVAWAIGAYFATVTLVYAGAYLSNAMWGDTLNYQLVQTFAVRIGAAASFLPFSETWRTTVAMLVVAGTIVVFVIVALVGAWLSRPSAAYLVSRSDRQSLAVAPRSYLKASSLALAIAGGAIWLLGSALATSPHKLRGEPLSNFTMLVSASKMLEMDNARWAAALEDQSEQRRYTVPESFERKNVILVFSDALRADRMGIYGYHRDNTPFLNELFEKGHLHRVDMALSTCSESFCGIASTFASRPFHEISMQNFRLNALLRSAGYKVRFFLTGDHRSWGYLRDFYGNDWDQIFDYQTLRVRDLHDDRYPISALTMVEPYGGQPNFMYFFLMSTHVSATRMVMFERYQPAQLDSARLQAVWNEMAGSMRIDNKVVRAPGLTSAELEAISNRYDNGVLQLDAHLRVMFRLLDQKGYLENSIVVILGDHGDGLGEKGHVGHTRTLYQEEIRIPLLVYDREKTRYRNSEFASQIDVAPTIVDRLGLPVPVSWQGRSLLKPSEDRITYHQTRRGEAPCFAVVERAGASLLKYIRCGNAQGAFREEVFDLVSDPTEQRNLVATIDRAVLSRLRAADARRSRIVTNACKSFECVD